ncbi:MAG: hypothetical protein H7831_11590 [Magnetococcus sp. WYHC-3]
MIVVCKLVFGIGKLIRLFATVLFNYAFIWAFFRSDSFFWFATLDFKNLYSQDTWWTPGFLMFLSVLLLTGSVLLIYYSEAVYLIYISSPSRVTFPLGAYFSFVFFSAVLFLGTHAYWVQEWGTPGTSTFKWVIDSPWIFSLFYAGMHFFGLKLGFWSDKDDEDEEQ